MGPFPVENFNHEDRALQLQWLQDLPLQGVDLRQSRRQDLQILGWPQQEGSPLKAQPPQGHLDRAVQAQAQEGCRGGDQQEEDQEDAQVPEGNCWRFTQRNLGQEKPKARAPKSSAGRSYPCCQGGEKDEE